MPLLTFQPTNPSSSSIHIHNHDHGPSSSASSCYSNRNPDSNHLTNGTGTVTGSHHQIEILSSPQFNQSNHLYSNSLNPAMDLSVMIYNDTQQQSCDSTPNPSSNSTGSAGAGPSGLSATQMAIRQRMIAMQAAKRGAKVPSNPSNLHGSTGIQGDSPPLRGEAIKLEIWRLTEKPVRVAHTLVNPPDLWTDDKGKRGQEREEIEIDDLVWSPDGQYLSLAVHIKRTTITTPTSSRFRRALLLYSVKDASQIRVILIDPTEETANLTATSFFSNSENPQNHIQRMSWVPLSSNQSSASASFSPPSSSSSPSSSSTSEFNSLLSSLPPLKPVPPIELTNFNARNLLPHQLRAQALQRQANSSSSGPADSDSSNHFVSRRKLYENGRGVLDRLPNSIYSFEINHNLKKRNNLDRKLLIGNSLLILTDQESKVHLFLDGSIPLGCFDPLKSIGASKETWQLKEAHLVKDEKDRESIHCCFIQKEIGKDQDEIDSTFPKRKVFKIGNGKLKVKVMRLNLPFSSDPSIPLTSTQTSQSAPAALLPPLLSLSTLSSSLTHLLTHVIDSSLHLSTVFHSTKVKNSFLNPMIEWNKIFSEISIKHASISPLNDLLHLSLTGQINEVSEQLMLHTLTEKPLGELESNIKKSLKFFQDSNRFWLIDGCEKLLAMLQRLRGMSRWPERFSSLLLSPTSRSSSKRRDELNGEIPPPLQLPRTLEELETYITSMIEIIKSVLVDADKVGKLAEMEMLAHSEFYKWWRVERERQERLRTDGDDPRLLTHHDPLTVTELLRRGFENRELERYLAPPNMKLSECKSSPETRRMGPKVPVDRDSSFLNQNPVAAVADEDKSASFAFRRNEPQQGEDEKEREESQEDRMSDFASNVGIHHGADQEMKDAERETSASDQDPSSKAYLKKTIQETKMKLLQSISNKDHTSTSLSNHLHYSLPTKEEISQTYFPPKLFSGPSNHLSLQESRAKTCSDISELQQRSSNKSSPCHYQTKEFLSIPQRLEMVGRDVTRLLDNSLRKVVPNHASVQESFEVLGIGNDQEESRWWEIPSSNSVSRHATAPSDPNSNSNNPSTAGFRTLFLDHKDLNAKRSVDSFDLVAFLDRKSSSSSSTQETNLNLLSKRTKSSAEASEISLAKISLLSSDSRPLSLLDYGFFVSKSSEASTGVELFLLLKESSTDKTPTTATTYLTSIPLPTLDFRTLSGNSGPEIVRCQPLKINPSRTHIFDSKDRVASSLALNFGKKSCATIKSEGKLLEYFDLEFFADEEEEEEAEEEEEDEDGDEEEEEGEEKEQEQDHGTGSDSEMS